MRGRFLIIVLLCSMTQAQASDLDPWFGTDKWIHGGVSIGIAAVSYPVFSPIMKEPWQRALASGGISLAVGSLKELADATNGGVASWRDMTWNFAGAAIGAGLSLGIDYWFFR